MKTKGNLIKGFLAVFALLSVVSLAMTVFCIMNGKRLSDYGTSAILDETDLAVFAGDSLFAAEKGGKTLRATVNGKEVSAGLDSEITGLYSSDGTVAVCLQNRRVVFYDEAFALLGSVEPGYPVDGFAFSAKRKTIAFTASTSSTRNYIFVYENSTPSSVGERYSVSSPVRSAGIGVNNADGNVYVAGYNSAVCKLVPSSSGKGETVEVFRHRLGVSSFLITESGYFVLGSSNGDVDVYDEKYLPVRTYGTGNMPVTLAGGYGEEFSALTEDGKEFFLSAAEDYSVRVAGVSVATAFSRSRSGETVALRPGARVLVSARKASSASFALRWKIPLVWCFCIFFVLTVVFTAMAVSPENVRKAKALGRNIAGSGTQYLMLLPIFAFLSVFIYCPVVWGFSIAFRQYRNGVAVDWVFLDNFQKIFTNEYFLSSIKNMLIFLITDLLKALIIPVIVAELLVAMRSKRGQYAARILMYIPGVLPGVATMLLWRYGVYGTDGLLNSLFAALGNAKLAAHDFLGSESTAIWSLVWIGFPWVGAYIILYGALTGISVSYFEAAELDGCTGMKRIFLIDIPMIRPQLKFVFITSFISSIQDFNRVYLTTEGGPGKATYTPALEMFYNINKFYNYGVAAAMGIFLFVIIFAFSMFFLYAGKRGEEGET
ncbi:MAG: sugar ABC transporter permease [Candidatus Borkfalkiaceae bacterium]|nr:sugar ABC transporter permease [Christensenellaceae bacterium]